jgi:hypothetical protein
MADSYVIAGIKTDILFIAPFAVIASTYCHPYLAGKMIPWQYFILIPGRCKEGMMKEASKIIACNSDWAQFPLHQHFSSSFEVFPAVPQLYSFLPVPNFGFHPDRSPGCTVQYDHLQDIPSVSISLVLKHLPVWLSHNSADNANIKSCFARKYRKLHSKGAEYFSRLQERC